MAVRDEKRWRLAILGLVLVSALAVMISGPASSQAAPRSCGSIVRNNDGDYYKSQVTILQGAVGCGEAKQLLRRAFNFQFNTKVGPWSCSPINFGEGTIHNQRCVRESEGESESAAIKTSHPRYCRECTGIEK